MLTSKYKAPTRLPAVVLTPRRRSILQLLARHLTRLGYTPTMREICDLEGMASPGNAGYHMAILELAGYILIPRLAGGDMIAHAIQLTAAGWDIVNADAPEPTEHAQ